MVFNSSQIVCELHFELDTLIYKFNYRLFNNRRFIETPVTTTQGVRFEAISHSWDY